NTGALYNLALVYEKVDPKESIALWERYIQLAGSQPTEKDWVDVAKLHLRKLKNQSGRASRTLAPLWSSPRAGFAHAIRFSGRFGRGAGAPLRDSESEQALQLRLVEALNDLTVHDDDGDGHLTRQLDQLLARLGAGHDVDILEGDPLRRKILFRRLAGPSRGARVDRNLVGAHDVLLVERLARLTRSQEP